MKTLDIRKSEFVTKTQFLCEYIDFKEKIKKFAFEKESY